jgi:glycosyltransferase involved in cell wall biosynthesis
MIVIPNGYDIKLFSDHSSRRFIRKNLSISDSTIIIGSVGRFNKYKDHYTFIKSAIRVLEMSVKELDVKFILIGRNILESNSEIFDLIKNTKYCKNFYLLGEKKDIINYYFSFDIFCLHSISEGFPNVLAEAMATSLPCISTDVGDAKIILNNNTFIALPSDHIDLSNKLINMINLSESQRKYIGQINQRRIESEYSTISFFSKYNNLYRSEY